MTFDQLIAFYGTQGKAGSALGELGEGDGKGLAQSSVFEWKEAGIPSARQAQYELLTKGRLKAERPKRKAA